MVIKILLPVCNMDILKIKFNMSFFIIGGAYFIISVAYFIICVAYFIINGCVLL